MMTLFGAMQVVVCEAARVETPTLPCEVRGGSWVRRMRHYARRCQCFAARLVWAQAMTNTPSASTRK
jgi:hypothetical protein